MKYLGLPSSFNKPKKENYKELLDRVGKKKKKLEGCTLKLSSQAGRTMLIRMVASTIPSYYVFFQTTKISMQDTRHRLQEFFVGLSKGQNSQSDTKVLENYLPIKKIQRTRPQANGKYKPRTISKVKLGNKQQ